MRVSADTDIQKKLFYSDSKKEKNAASLYHEYEANEIRSSIVCLHVWSGGMHSIRTTVTVITTTEAR